MKIMRVVHKHHMSRLIAICGVCVRNICIQKTTARRLWFFVFGIYYLSNANVDSSRTLVSILNVKFYVITLLE